VELSTCTLAWPQIINKPVRYGKKHCMSKIKNVAINDTTTNDDDDYDYNNDDDDDNNNK
jgi:hypothetical protein